MSKQTETRQKLKGEDRYFTCFRPFKYNGHQIEENQVLGPLPLDVFNDLGRYQLYGRLSGGRVTVVEELDGYHRLSFRGTRYVEGERWYKVRFVKNNNLFPEGYLCRLRMSDIREFTNRVRYRNDAELPAHMQVPLIIMEDRVRPSISAEEAAQRAADIENGLAEQSRPSWMQPAMITPKLS